MYNPDYAISKVTESLIKINTIHEYKNYPFIVLNTVNGIIQQ